MDDRLGVGDLGGKPFDSTDGTDGGETGTIDCLCLKGEGAEEQAEWMKSDPMVRSHRRRCRECCVAAAGVAGAGFVDYESSARAGSEHNKVISIQRQMVCKSRGQSQCSAYHLRFLFVFELLMQLAQRRGPLVMGIASGDDGAASETRRAGCAKYMAMVVRGRHRIVDVLPIASPRSTTFDVDDLPRSRRVSTRTARVSSPIHMGLVAGAIHVRWCPGSNAG